MSSLARLLAIIGGLTALVGVVALAVVAVLALTSDDPLSLFAVPLLALGLIVVIATVFVFAVIAQGVTNLRQRDE